LTLHAIWPLVYVWAMTRQDASLVASGEPQPHLAPTGATADNDLVERVRALEERLKRVEEGLAGSA
jgi:hypothetical protein